MDHLTARLWRLDWKQFKSAACLPIALAIARRSYESGMCWARQSTIGDDCGVSKQTVARCLQELEEKGLLARVEHFREDGSRTSDTMWLTLPELVLERTVVDHSELDRRRSGLDKKRPRTKTPPTTVIVRPLHEDGDGLPKESPQNVISNGLEEIRERHQGDDAGSDEDSPPGEDIPAAVEMIWKAGSSIARTRSSKADIESGLRAALKRGAALESIMRGYGAYLRTPDATKDDGAFQRGAHVILAKDRWAGYLEEAPNTPAVGAPAATAPATADERTIWALRVDLFSKGKAWDSNHGPEPGRLGCLAPSDILAAHGFTPPDVGDDNAGAFD